MNIKSLILIALFCASSAATGAMYKWTDSNGNLQYGEHPPGGVEAEYIRPPRAPAQPAGQNNGLYSTLGQLEQDRARRQQQKDQAAREQQLATARQQTCERARQDLAALQRGGHRRVRLPDGTVTYLDAEQKQRYIEFNQQKIEANCD